MPGRTRPCGTSTGRCWAQNNSAFLFLRTSLSAHFTLPVFGYVLFRGVEEGPLVQQDLYLTPLGTLYCAYCGAVAAGSGREDDPFVISHPETCEFAREVTPPRPPGKHRAPVPG